MSVNKIRIILFITWIFFVSSPSFSQIHLEVTPGLSISETYDDNIYLESTDKTSDYITAVSPSINFLLTSRSNHLGLQLAPTFVWYEEEKQNDTIRHSGTLSFGQELSQNLRFDFSNAYSRSEDPIEEGEVGEFDRDTRDLFWRNSTHSTLQYHFGPENTFSLGYDIALLENEDITLDDNRTRNYSADMTYWFNTENGMEIHYGYMEAEFFRDDDNTPGDHYTGSSTSARYNHRFSSHTTGLISYGLTRRSFAGTTENYNVHDGPIGLDTDFAQNFSLSFAGGYFVQENEQSNDVSGYTYHGSLTKQFEHGSLSIGGSGGWNESYLGVERRGFTRYWAINMDTEYQIADSLNIHAGGSYRHNRDFRNREWWNWSGNCGLAWAFSNWSSLSLDYSHHEAMDDVGMAEYQDNRVVLSISASRLFRW